MHMNNIKSQPRELSLDEIEHVSGGVWLKDKSGIPAWDPTYIPQGELDPNLAPSHYAPPIFDNNSTNNGGNTQSSEKADNSWSWDNKLRTGARMQWQLALDWRD